MFLFKLLQICVAFWVLGFFGTIFFAGRLDALVLAVPLLIIGFSIYATLWFANWYLVTRRNPEQGEN